MWTGSRVSWHRENEVKYLWMHVRAARGVAACCRRRCRSVLRPAFAGPAFVFLKRDRKDQAILSSSLISDSPMTVVETFAMPGCMISAVRSPPFRTF